MSTYLISTTRGPQCSQNGAKIMTINTVVTSKFIRRFELESRNYNSYIVTCTLELFRTLAFLPAVCRRFPGGAWSSGMARLGYNAASPPEKTLCKQALTPCTSPLLPFTRSIQCCQD